MCLYDYNMNESERELLVLCRVITRMVILMAITMPMLDMVMLPTSLLMPMVMLLLVMDLTTRQDMVAMVHTMLLDPMVPMVLPAMDITLTIKR